MSLQKPYDISLRGTTIAGEEDNLIKWKVSGGIQTDFQVDIYNNSDGALIFTSNKITTYDTSYNLLSNSITNGIECKIIITIWDESLNSTSSDPEIFQTSSRPVVVIDSIGTVGNPSYNFTATYSQGESVAMKSYVAHLYNSSKVLLKSSDIKTITPIEYLVNNLQSEKSYYIEFQITSEKGLTGTSGLVLFDVLYSRPQMNVDLTAINVENAGIELSWKIVQIIGTSDNTVNYLNNEEIDLTDSNTVYFQEGFSLNKNFTLKLWVRNPNHKENLLTLNGSNGKINLHYSPIEEKFILNKLINENKSEWKSGTVNSGAYFVLVQQIGDNMNISAEEII